MFKKSLLVFALGLFAMAAFVTPAHAENLVYPFDSITIVEAYKYDVLVTYAPQTGSFLEGQIVGDTLTIYVGNIEMQMDANLSSSSKVVIVTNSLGVDLARWIINSYYWQGENQESFIFASHITIDPLIGVVKLMDIPSVSATVKKIGVDSYEFLDDFQQTHLMVPGTYAFETGLSIVISAYSGGA